MCRRRLYWCRFCSSQHRSTSTQGGARPGDADSFVQWPGAGLLDAPPASCPVCRGRAKEWQTGPVMQQLQHRSSLRAGGGHFCLLAARCNADSVQGYPCVATSRGCSENAVVSILRDDRNFSALWLPCDAFIWFFFSLYRRHLGHVFLCPKDFLWLPLWSCPKAQAHVLLSTGSKLPLPDVVEEEVDHFTQAGNL